jgi:hypothetical protein
MLSGFPVEFRFNGNSSESIFFYGDLGLLTDAILEAGTKPRVDVTGYIYGCCSDKVVPMRVSVLLFPTLVIEVTHHEVRV